MKLPSIAALQGFKWEAPIRGAFWFRSKEPPFLGCAQIPCKKSKLWVTSRKPPLSPERKQTNKQKTNIRGWLGTALRNPPPSLPATSAKPLGDPSFGQCRRCLLQCGCGTWRNQHLLDSLQSGEQSSQGFLVWRLTIRAMERAASLSCWALFPCEMKTTSPRPAARFQAPAPAKKNKHKPPRLRSKACRLLIDKPPGKTLCHEKGTRQTHTRQDLWNNAPQPTGKRLCAAKLRCP